LPYDPKPIETAHIDLRPELRALTERLAASAHDDWARRRMAEGWRYGETRDDAQKLHPCLVPYAELPESEKEHDRAAALGTLKSVIALGFRIERDGG